VSKARKRKSYKALRLESMKNDRQIMRIGGEWDDGRRKMAKIRGLEIGR
jgi:hypothetical protein